MAQKHFATNSEASDSSLRSCLWNGKDSASSGKIVERKWTYSGKRVERKWTDSGQIVERELKDSDKIATRN